MKRLISLFVISLISLMSFSQNDNDIVLKVGSENITKKEFLNIYQKNNPNSDKSIDKRDLREYLELFINYKLKLKEARELGMDKDPNYISEVDIYRKQLVEPYINDRDVTEALVKEAYERSKEFVRASHILISLPENFSPSDTLEAYKKALSIRDRIIKGESFEALALEFSDDPSAKDQEPKEGQKTYYKGNKGDLGYFTSFNMIYNFESAAYSLSIGEISMPVRTNRGYHIVKLTDRIPAFFSTADLAHIWVNFDNHDSKEECRAIIDKAYEMLKQNISFDSVVKLYSDDMYSKQKKGILSAQRVTNMPYEYVQKLNSTPINQFTQPFETRFGCHIIMPISFTKVQSLDEQRATVEQRIAKDSRSFRTIEEFTRKAKNEYGFKEYPKKLNAINDIITDSIFKGKWSVPVNFIGEDTVFIIGDRAYNQLEIAKIIEERQTAKQIEYIPNYINKLYSTIVDEKVLAYADAKLEDKHPELKASIDEFRDGILIFSITDKFVWNRSITDSIGLEEFYQNNKNNYMWQERADATIFTLYKDLDSKKALKIIKKAYKKNKTNAEILELLAKKFKIKENLIEYIDYKWAKFEKNDNKIVDKTNWSLGISPVIEEGRTKNIVILHKVLAPEVKTLNEARGILTSDYQEYLESQWIKSLREKYTYTVNYNVFDSIN